jgi:hypothetical protein
LIKLFFGEYFFKACQVDYFAGKQNQSRRAQILKDLLRLVVQNRSKGKMIGILGELKKYG